MAKFRLNDPNFLQDPSPVLAQMRANGALVRINVPIIGQCWATTTPRFMRPLTRNILNLDGAEHKRIRAAVDNSFSRAAIDALRPEIAQIANHYLDQIDPAKPVDITEDYARLLPLDVISALLGIKPALRQKLARAIAPCARKLQRSDWRHAMGCLARLSTAPTRVLAMTKFSR